MPRTNNLLREMRRILAISDIHADYKENLQLVKSWSADTYKNDVLLVAGDVTDSMSLLNETLQHLTTIFYKVFFVPGNHELWIRRGYTGNSIEKFHDILRLCESLNVQTKSERVQLTDSDFAWIVPLHSWYATPDDDSEDSLYHSWGEECDNSKAEEGWMDNYLCKWPRLSISRSNYFADFNKTFLEEKYDPPVISFSHFLPRYDLIIPTDTEKQIISDYRKSIGLESTSTLSKPKILFNFSKFAGCKRLEEHIRTLESVVHVYGHQHRNRDRTVDGIRYISHCIGNPREREAGAIMGYPCAHVTPKEVWHTDEEFTPVC